MIPTARTKPGKAYPKERDKLADLNKRPLSNLFRKVMAMANTVQIIPAKIPSQMVLKKLCNNFLENRFSEGKNIAQFVNSITGKIKPIKRGKKQKLKAKKLLIPFSWTCFVFLKVEAA